MYDHALVIAIRSEWRLGQQVHQLGLELPSGTRVAMPFGLKAKPGDVLVVMTENEFEAWKTKGRA